MGDGDREDHSFEPKDGRGALDVRDTMALLEDGLEEEVDAQAADFFAYIESTIRGTLLRSTGEEYSTDQKQKILGQLREKYEELRNGNSEFIQRQWETLLSGLKLGKGVIHDDLVQRAPHDKEIRSRWKELVMKVIQLRISQCGDRKYQRQPASEIQESVREQQTDERTLDNLRTDEPAWTQEFVRWAVTQDFLHKKALFDSWLDYLREQGNMNALPVRPGTLNSEKFPSMRSVTFVVMVGGKIQEVKVKIWVGLDSKSKKPTVFLEFI